jgi:hypothetical protein
MWKIIVLSALWSFIGLTKTLAADAIWYCSAPVGAGPSHPEPFKFIQTGNQLIDAQKCGSE